MINLSTLKTPEEHIQEELYLAGIKKVEEDRKGAPYPIGGRVGNWHFTRFNYFWMASTPEIEKGLPIDVASYLYQKKYPIIGENQPKIYGQVIRARGTEPFKNPTDAFLGTPAYLYHIDNQIGLTEFANIVRAL